MTIATVQQALLAVLSIVLTILLPLLVKAAFSWLDSQAKANNLGAAATMAHTIVRGIEQEYGSASAAGPAKKEAAVATLQATCPWLPPGVAGILIESGVHALDAAEGSAVTLAPLTLSPAPPPAPPEAPAPLPEPPAVV